MAKGRAETPLPGAGAAFPIAVDGLGNATREIREAAEGFRDTVKSEATTAAWFL